MPGSPRIRINGQVEFHDQALVRFSDRIKKEYMYQMGGALLKFAKNAVSRRAPKNADSDHGRMVYTTWKSGKRKGQRRAYYKKGRYSAPGQPPFKRSADPFNLSLMSFVVNLREQTLYLGPLKHKGSKGMSRTVPNVHEFGGNVRVIRRKKKPPKFNSYGGYMGGGNSRRSNQYSGSTVVTKKYDERPYMYPSLVRGAKWFRRRARRRF